jgi:hypothetical protein
VPLHVPPSWAADLEGLDALVFAPDDPTDDWDWVKSTLTLAFGLSQTATASRLPIVYVVDNDDLLGRRQAPRAMVATGLLSGARTAALEAARDGVPVNVLAIEADSSPTVICRWVRLLCEPGGPTGELVHLGSGHIGKALA